MSKNFDQRPNDCPPAPRVPFAYRIESRRGGGGGGGRSDHRVGMRRPTKAMQTADDITPLAQKH